jgi:rare lipoprotein A
MRWRLGCLLMRLLVELLIRGGSLAILTIVPVAQAASEARPTYEATGHASWYGDELRGRKTANGESFNPDGFTAAHRTLPFQSYAEVTALDTGRTILVRINDRGPYHGNRIIDLSHGAARQLGMVGHGARMVRVRRVEATESEKLALRNGRSVPIRAMITGNELERLRIGNKWSAPTSTRATFPVGGPPYFIRIGTFSSKGRAEAMAGRLGAALFEVDGLYQVRLGPYADAGKVNAALAPLAAKGYPDVRIVR